MSWLPSIGFQFIFFYDDIVNPGASEGYLNLTHSPGGIFQFNISEVTNGASVYNFNDSITDFLVEVGLEYQLSFISNEPGLYTLYFASSFNVSFIVPGIYIC
jgi:hypothetical protein